MGNLRKDWALSAEQKMDARSALELIPPGSGLTLEGCVRMALHLPRVSDSGISVGEAVDRFLRHALQELRREEMRQDTWDFYEQHLRTFEGSFGDVKLKEINRSWLTKYFDGLEKNRPQRWRALRRLLKWSVANELLASYPASEFTVKDSRPVVIEILTADEVRCLFVKGGIYTAAYGLVVLGGVRPMELRHKDKEPMTWRQARESTRTVRVRADQAKNGKARAVKKQLPMRLWAVLRLGRKRLREAGLPCGDDDPICPFRMVQANEHAKHLIKRWGHDILRHTCATAHLNAYGDLTATSLLIGHEGKLSLLHQRYLGEMDEVDAVKIMGGL